VLADVIDIARAGEGAPLPPFGQPAATLRSAPPASEETPCAHYLRMALRDRPGALARVAAVLGEAGISIDRMRQYDHPGQDAPVLIVTHPCVPSALGGALKRLEGADEVTSPPVALQIQDV
jgi:homoserine dehydrogenase